MAFKEVEKGPEEIGRYWKPEKVGDAIEGNVYAFVDGDYGKQIDLYRGVLEDGEYNLCQLPAHADLKRTYVNLNRGDYIRVEVTEIKEPQGKSQYGKMIYKVLKDEDKAVEFPDDDYYADE
ncbi:hypothetical protein [uncultured Methanobrevibacter sp.]|uniref:hypothetical protein n=1 Tax=uncultured Methanobrevibacter sp. TaxID=253161 RepID=UPI0025E97D8B|nr:hypothetical protein [uncultured Methanobrevibacter sp.]